MSWLVWSLRAKEAKWCGSRTIRKIEESLEECLEHPEDPELYRCEEREGGVWSSRG